MRLRWWSTSRRTRTSAWVRDAVLRCAGTVLCSVLCCGAVLCTVPCCAVLGRLWFNHHGVCGGRHPAHVVGGARPLSQDPGPRLKASQPCSARCPPTNLSPISITCRHQNFQSSAAAAAAILPPPTLVGLDVYEDEPLMKPGLAECDNAVLVPHIASATEWTRAGMVRQSGAGTGQGQGPCSVRPHLCSWTNMAAACTTGLPIASFFAY